MRWVRREHNVVADFICNFVTGGGRSWQKSYIPTLPEDFNIVVHSDGGARHQCGAASWIAEAVFLNTAGAWDSEPLAASGVYFNADVTPFAAEALALYNATSFLLECSRKFQNSI